MARLAMSFPAWVFLNSHTQVSAYEGLGPFQWETKRQSRTTVIIRPKSVLSLGIVGPGDYPSVIIFCSLMQLSAVGL